MHESFVKMSDVNAILPHVCEHCKDKLEDLPVVNLESQRMDEIRGMMARISEEAKNLLSWANTPIAPVKSCSMARFHEICSVVEEYYGLVEGEINQSIKNRQSTHRLSMPRYIVMYLIRSQTGATLADIAAIFGNKHHTTILHALQRVADERQKEGKLDKEIREISKMLEGE